jgi:seryl-tRNA synthetase
VIDLKILRADPERVRSSQQARGEDAGLVDELLAADARRRELETTFGQLRNRHKQVSSRIGPLRGAVKKAADDSARAEAQSELDEVMATAQDLASQVKDADVAKEDAATDAERLLAALSNLVDPAAPVGGEDDFTVLEHVGTPRDFAAEGFAPRDHLEIGARLGAIDVERGAKVSGSRFYFLTGVGALLELALINHAVSLATAWGLVPVIPPSLVRPSAMEGTGFLGQAAENVYRVELDDLYLVGTAEVPLAAYHSDEILDASSLPRRYVGWSPCYRREAGTYGKDTTGIFRVHWFDKVEMFSYVAPEDAVDEHARLLAYERQFQDSLEVPYRIIDVASGDLGASAARKFDIEAWIPTQGRYREVTSTSNCTEFQSRRLRVRMRDADGVRPLATLNGTLVAVTRAIVAILENHQQADGSVHVPAALQPYLGRAVLDPLP